MSSFATSDGKKGSDAGKASKFGPLKTNLERLGAPSKVVRFNSTSTMYVDHTISVPDNQKTMEAVADQILELILKGEQELKNGKKGSRLLDEEKTQETLPGPKLLKQVINHIFKTGQLSIDCTIIALIYIDRLLAAQIISEHGDSLEPMFLHRSNWRPILAITFMLASKVWDDLSMINQDFSTFLPFTLAQLNEWERKFLNAIKFDVRVGASVYARYYFNIRSFLQKKHVVGAELPVAQEKKKPLDTAAAAKLEALSHEAQLRFIQYYGEGDLDGAQGSLAPGAGDSLMPTDNIRRSKSVGDENQLAEDDEAKPGARFAVLS